MANIFSRYNSLIGFDIYSGPGISVKIEQSNFDNISICGSLMNSEIASPLSDLRPLMIASLFNEPPALRKASALSSEISIISSDFSRFGLDLRLTDADLYISSYNNLDYEQMAPILNLNGFPGYIELKNN